MTKGDGHSISYITFGSSEIAVVAQKEKDGMGFRSDKACSVEIVPDVPQ